MTVEQAQSALDVLEERLRYHIADLLPDDADWRDFAAKLIRELKDEGFVVERPYLLLGKP